MNLIRRAISGLAAAALAVLLGFGVWMELESRRTAGAETRPVLVEIRKGQGVKAIAAELKRQGVLVKAVPFVVRYQLFHAPVPLKAGPYEFDAPAAPAAVIEALIKGRVYLKPVTIPEGLTGEEIFAQFDRAGFGPPEAFRPAFLDASAAADWDARAGDLEGYLFPETYRLARGSAPAEILAAMVGQFGEVFNESWRRRAAELGMSVREIVTLASLIEKETARPEEKPLVSAVFHNRLRKRMRLDCDPTIIYALKREGAYTGRLRTKDLRLDSPYNTYRHAGLPPGPICNPGRDSLEAALYPAESEFLFFVSRNDGSHQFSRTLAEHQAAVDTYQR